MKLTNKVMVPELIFTIFITLQGAEKSQLPEVGIKPGSKGKHSVSFYCKAVEACFIPIPTTYFPA